ncbi:MAG: trigger factor [Anaerovoracaceae bacterium]
MKAVLLSKENNEAKFTIEFSADEFEAAIVKAYQKSKDQFQIDGFRKGKAPRSIIEKKYGEDIFVEDAVNELFGQEYPNAINELKLEVIDHPSVEFGEIKKGEAFVSTITVPVYPVVVVENYKGIEIEKVSADVTAEDIDAEIANLQKRNARMINVEREVKDGDSIVLDYAGFVGEEQFEGGTAEGYPLVIGSGSFIPGFEEQLIGVKKEEEVEVKVTFPTEYHSEDLAGKEAIFKCTVHEVKEEELPTLDDEFAKDVSEFDTLEELKKDTEEKLIQAKKVSSEHQMKDQAIMKLVEGNDLEVPAVMIEDEIDQMLKEFDGQLRQQGLELQQYFQFIGKAAEDFRKEVRGDAEKRVKTRMLISAVVDAEKIEYTEEEIEKEYESMATQYGLEADKIKEMLGGNVEMLGNDIKMRKAVDLLFDNAVIK